jgi:hypothetical protein
MIFPALVFTAIFPLNFIELFYATFKGIPLFFILPFFLLYYWSLFIFCLLLFAKLYLILVNLIHTPQEGLFDVSLKDKDYLFYALRKSIKQFILKVYNYYPLPWIKILPLKLFHIKIPPDVGVLDSYIESDFVEFGSETILGEGAVILSSLLVDGKLLIKKTKIGERATIGAYSIVAPGTIVEDGAILGMGSYTNINQVLESNWIYIGRPAKKLKQVQGTKIN